MEEMLGQVMLPPISLRSLLANFNKTLEKDKHPKTSDEIRAALKRNKDPLSFKELSRKCCISQLSQSDDMRVTNYIPGFTEQTRRPNTQIPDEALLLQTVKTLVQEKDKTFKNPFERTRHSFKAVQLPPSAPRSVSEDSCDLGIYVRIYRPVRAKHMGKSLEKPVFAEEFQCLGSNLLTELRDKISCVCNKKRFFDISENPNDELCDKESDPGYFFITDTFYNDKRNIANVDYSETVREWAKTAQGLRDIKFKAAKMEETRFLDLTVSLGFPQLYHHHGNCEHVFVISQIEYLTPYSYKADSSKYPLLMSWSLFNTRACNMCGRQGYTYIVEQSLCQLHDPAYLCSKCFFGYHYIDGKKVGQFKAYKVNYVSDEEELDDIDEEEIELRNEEEDGSIEESQLQSNENNVNVVGKRKKSAEITTPLHNDDREFISIVKVENYEIS